MFQDQRVTFVSYDAIVIGGGMVGSATALGLAKLGRTVALIEKNLPQDFSPEQPPDVRLSALSLSTVKFLNQLGAWQHISSMRCQPYNELAVWENAQTEADKTVFTASSIGCDSLGQFVENRLTQLALHKEIAQYSAVDLYSNSNIEMLDTLNNQIVLKDGQKLHGKWIIGADGAQSKVRTAAGIGQTGWQYAQQALGVIVQLETNSGSRTWQQFKSTGPVAFLPMYDNFAALIWYHDANEISRLTALSEEQLKIRIIDNFPSIGADFSISSRGSFPLNRAHANQYVKAHTVLVGDSAHTINPLAGQGVNIGFKDVEALLNVFEQNGMPDTQKMSKEYEDVRRRQNLLMMTAMDVFYLAFSNEIEPLKMIRNLALKAAGKAGPLKQQALKYAVGI